MTATPFKIMDSTLLTRMSGLSPAVNLREMRDRLGICSDDVIYHHFCETWLRPTFDDPEYRNDFAVWASAGLHDRVLAEQLASIDPYDYDSIDQLRSRLIDYVEDRLGDLQPWVPMARPGREFHFMQATTVVFDTGESLDSPRDLAAAVERMTNGSVYFHFLEARRRSPIHLDDFSTWLIEHNSGYQDAVAALHDIDIYFSDLAEIRQELARVFMSLGGSR